VNPTLSALANPSPSPSPRRPASETREHVLAVAHDLFYTDGIRQTGADLDDV
jgi:hypothetical protein